ncbi:MAG: 50S ribosomal protein L10 [Actinobacteria bacterium]|nr:MAG: 50S ribosomal protein L10 [Actinomycetota bacterium]
MAKEDKKQIVQEIADKLSKSKSVVLTDYRGLSVRDISELRGKLRQSGIDYKIYKNTMLRLATKAEKIEGLDSFLEGPTAVAFDYEDEVNASKVLTAFAKDHKVLEIKAGLLENKVLSVDQIKQLASLPGKDQLIATLMARINGPIGSFLNVLNAPIREFGSVIKQIKEASN